MAKFCTKCGSPLEEGKPCKCESEKKEVKNVSSSNFVELLKEYLNVVKGMVKKPIDTLKEKNDESNFNLSLVSIGVTSIILGFVMCFIIKSMMGGLSGLVDIPYVKVFLVGFITMAAMISVMALIAYVIVDKLLKSETSIKKMFILFGLSSIVFAEVLIIAALLAIFEINATVIYIIMAIGALLWFAYNLRGIESYSKIDVNMIGYTMAATNATTMLIMYYLIKNVIVKILM